jgi:hypothetical protein
MTFGSVTFDKAAFIQVPFSIKTVSITTFIRIVGERDNLEVVWAEFSTLS